MRRKIFYKSIPEYYMVSLLTMCINLGLYWLLIYYGIYYIFSAILGFMVGTIISYLLNRFWTFRNTTINFKIGYIRSLVVALIILILIVIFTTINVEIFKLKYLPARIIAGLIAGSLSFIADAKFSFSVWPKKNI